MILVHLENIAAWVVLVCAAAAVLGAIWALADTLIGYTVAAKFITQPGTPIEHCRCTSFSEPAVKGFVKVERGTRFQAGADLRLRNSAQPDSRTDPRSSRLLVGEFSRRVH